MSRSIFIGVFVLAMMLSALGFAAGQAGQERQDSETRPAATQAQVVKPLRAAAAQPVQPTPSVATQLSAGAAIQASAACCFKQCKEGGNCGKSCKVVDSASQCDLNLVFECPASKGLNCFSGDCTCQ